MARRHPWSNRKAENIFMPKLQQLKWLHSKNHSVLIHSPAAKSFFYPVITHDNHQENKRIICKKGVIRTRKNDCRENEVLWFVKNILLPRIRYWMSSHITS